MTVECIKFRPFASGSLQGFADLFLPRVGVEIYGCTIHMKDGKRWVNLPSKEYKDKDTGETKYSSVVRFPNKDHYTQFQQLAKDAVDKWCQENGVEAQNEPQPQHWNDECPF